MAERKAVIKNADMSEDMQQDAVDCASQSLEKYNIEKARRSPRIRSRIVSPERAALHGDRTLLRRLIRGSRRTIASASAFGRRPCIAHLPPTMRRPSAHP